MLCIFRKIGLLLKNKSKFDSLRKILPILSFILLVAIGGNSQETRNPGTDPGKLVVKTYPNPASDNVTFKVGQNISPGELISSNIKVFDMTAASPT